MKVPHGSLIGALPAACGTQQSARRACMTPTPNMSSFASGNLESL
jgi:hypothetical protein